jgi:hypothetical protein
MIIRHKISSRLINARQLFSSTMPTRNRAELSPTLASCNSQEGDVPVMVPYSPLIDTCTETPSWNEGFSDGEIYGVILDSVFALWFYRVNYKSKPSHFTSLTPKRNGNKSFSPFSKINFAMDPTCSAFICSG